MIEVPIFHVNGEDPEAVVYVGELALDFRQTFGKDVVIDMVCYRRHGHNEGDEPAFTQPLMYEKIKDRISIRELYTEQLVMAGELSSDEAETIAETFADKMQEVLDEVQRRRRRAAADQPRLRRRLDRPDARLLVRAGRDRRLVSRRCARSPSELVAVPAGLHGQPQARPAPRGPASRRSRPRGRSTGRSPRCWPSARCSGEDTPVRLSGQDSRRGTFSQRHAVLVDTQDRRALHPAQPPERRARPSSASTTACSPRRPCSASTTATRSTSRTC